jgi:hypothetical protein
MIVVSLGGLVQQMANEATNQGERLHLSFISLPFRICLKSTRTQAAADTIQTLQPTNPSPSNPTL